MKTVLVCANILCVFFYKGLNGVYHFFFKELMKNCNCVISSSIPYMRRWLTRPCKISVSLEERGC